MKVLGHRIAVIRKNRKLTQARLSLMAGTSRAYLARVETDIQVPSLEVLERIAKALEVPAGLLLLDRTDLPKGRAYDALGNILDSLIELTATKL